jgi:hypothetical protein
VDARVDFEVSIELARSCARDGEVPMQDSTNDVGVDGSDTRMWQNGMTLGTRAVVWKL